jgi:hypothetical protein
MRIKKILTIIGKTPQRKIKYESVFSGWTTGGNFTPRYRNVNALGSIPNVIIIFLKSRSFKKR